MKTLFRNLYQGPPSSRHFHIILLICMRYYYLNICTGLIVFPPDGVPSLPISDDLSKSIHWSSVKAWFK